MSKKAQQGDKARVTTKAFSSKRGLFSRAPPNSSGTLPGPSPPSWETPLLGFSVKTRQPNPTTPPPPPQTPPSHTQKAFSSKRGGGWGLGKGIFGGRVFTDTVKKGPFSMKTPCGAALSPAAPRRTLEETLAEANFFGEPRGGEGCAPQMVTLRNL